MGFRCQSREPLLEETRASWEKEKERSNAGNGTDICRFQAWEDEQALSFEQVMKTTAVGTPQN